MSKMNAGVAVIGYGTAGVNAIIGMRNAGYTGKITVFSDTEILPYSPILTSYYAGGEKTYEECFPWSAEELDSLNADVLAGSPVLELDPAAHTIRTAQGEYEYAKCVLASGSRPMAYGFPQDCGYEPIVLRTMDNAQRLKDALENPDCRRVLVSGASMVALKTLEACLNHGKQCTMVGVNPHVLDFNALPETAIRFEKGLASYGVKMMFGNPIKDVEVIEGPGPDGRQLKVTFKDDSTDVFDEISVAHGMRSNLEFLPQGAVEMDRAILVDEFMRTSDPDIYAAGDVAQALELISGERRIVGIWKNAAVQGNCAGTAIAAEMAGQQPDPAKAYKGSIATNTIHVKDTLFISGGTMELTEDRYTETRATDDMTVIYVFERMGDDRRLVGFNLTCDTDEAGGTAYDTGAMLTLRIERAFGKN